MEENEFMKPALPLVPDKNGPMTISLNQLMDHAIQQIFHEITVLSELLPKKLDGDRKISLVQFAHSTRMLFVKLLALVKWVKGSKKSEACASICYLLDQQAQYFIDTADRMFNFKEELARARLPAFQVVAAVDVLTQGAYPRLPLCITERFIPKKKITVKEQANVLRRLNQVLQYRISIAAPKMSPRIKDIIIKNGFVSIEVPGEFKAQLTILGETDSVKWALLNIKILVEDYEIGYGTQLVHPLQLSMVHNVLQSRMDVSKHPINEVYTVLHSFAQSIQLDVLFCQVSQLSAGRLRNHIIIEEYDAKRRVLAIGYWLHRLTKRKGGPQYRSVAQYRIMIYGDKDDPDSGLKVRHYPTAQNLGELDDRPGRLSFDRLLSETLVVRCKERLTRIRKRLEAAEPKAMVALTGSAAPCLSLPLLRDTLDKGEESVIISVNMFSGKVLCTLPSLGNRTELKDLEKALYDNHSTEVLRKLLDRLKVLVMMDRHRRSVSTLQVRVINELQMAPFFQKVKTLAADRLCLQFIKEEHFYLVITFVANENLAVTTELFLICTMNDKVTMLELNKEHVQLAAPLEKVWKRESDMYADKVEEEEDWVPLAKRSRTKQTGGMERQLTAAVAAIDDRIALMRVCEELDKKGIQYRSLESEPDVGGLILHITDVSNVVEVQCADFFKNMSRCALRIDNRSRVIWPFECCMINIPLVRDDLEDKKGSSVCSWVIEVNGMSAAQANSGPEGISHNIIDRLSRYCHIYEIVHKFAKAYHAHYYQFCSIQAYTFHKLIIAYGENRDQLLILQFKTKPTNPSEKFALNFGQILPRTVYPEHNEVNWKEDSKWNAHSMMTQILRDKFNTDSDLVELMHYLIATCAPLHSLSSFSRIRFQSWRSIAQMLMVEIPYPLRLKCHLTPINESTVRLTYGILHLEFVLLEEQRVAIRDSSRGEPKCAGLHQFFKFISGGTAESYATDSEMRERHMKRTVSPSHAGPASLPPHMVSASPMTGSSLSVPGTMDVSSPAFISATHHVPLPTHSSPVTVDHQTLHKACTYVRDSESGQLRSPLDDYLFALVFLHRLGLGFEAYSKSTTNGVLAIHLKDLHVEVDSVRLSVQSVNPPSPVRPHEPSTINFNFHLDPSTMQLKVLINYSGSEFVPNASEVSIMEKYFETSVARLNNEMAVISFISICRLTVTGAPSVITYLMSQTTDTHSPWTATPQLVYITTPKDPNPNANRRFGPGIAIEQTNQHMLLLTNFKPQNQRSQDKKQQMKLVYNMQANTVRHELIYSRNTVKHQGDPAWIQEITTAVNTEAARTGECALGPAIRMLLERYSTNTMPPGSVSSSHMPGSVGPIGSVGPVSVGPPPVGSVGPPIGSVGGPVSVGGQGSVGVHNPASMMNPGSNTQQM